MSRIPSIAYILKINTPLSNEYAKVCSDSCDQVGIEWEYFQGYQNMKGRAAWCKTGIKMKFQEKYNHIENPSSAEKAECCSAGHASIWKKIAEGEHESAIILEHDAIMLHSINIEIPDNMIVVLGYKTPTPQKYNHIQAGPPTELKPIQAHEGAHAYAITKKTAVMLIEEIEQRGLLGCVDNAYFLKNRKTKVPISIMSPTPAIGWLRKSSIWANSAQKNYAFIDSFKQHYNA